MRCEAIGCSRGGGDLLVASGLRMMENSLKGHDYGKDEGMLRWRPVSAADCVGKDRDGGRRRS